MTITAEPAPFLRTPGRDSTISLNLPPQNRSKVIIWALLAPVCLVYALPLLISLAQSGKIPPVFRPDETIYMVRTSAAMRGDPLGNPYIAGYDAAPKYLPELSERAVAIAGRILRLNIVEIAAAFRVLQPAAIFLGVAWISLALDLTPVMAALAGVLTVLGPSMGMLHFHRAGLPAFLRYTRFLSAGFHTAVFVAALGLVALCWNRPNRFRAVTAGLAVGAVFYLPIFYWSALWAGVIGLAILSHAERRSCLLVMAGVSVALALPMLANSVRTGANPLVQETLHRAPALTMLPGRHLEFGIAPHLALCAASAVVAWRLRRRAKVFLFPFAFFVASVPLLLQNLITNRQIQAYHFVDALNPLWAIMAAAVLAQLRPKKVLVASIFALVIGFGASEQVVDYLRLRSIVGADEAAWAPDWSMPHTLEWLQESTPPGSVVMASSPEMEILPIFTHNKVYWADFARQHVMPTDETDTRRLEARRWTATEPLTYRVDYFLQDGAKCSQIALSWIRFRDAGESTCVWQRPK
ncbi:MAG: hypothetical protein ACXVZM_07475 [Terriglobales bacterium]